MNIIIADTSEHVREEVKKSLLQIPDACVIGEAESEEAAIDLICRAVPDLAIVNLQLTNNAEISGILRARTLYPQMKLLMLTDSFDSIAHHKASALGAEYVFDKVHEFEDMLDVVRLLVETADYDCKN